MNDWTDKETARRLAKVLLLLDSPHDGEALSAARRAVALLRQSGLSAEDLAQRLSAAPPRPGGTQDRIIALETQLAAASASLKSVKAELAHWQDQAWTAASLVAELEDAVAEARRALADRPEAPPPLPRSQAEKRAAVMALLHDPATAALPDREIARRLSLSPQTIGNWRRRLGLAPNKAHIAREIAKAK